MRILLTLSYDGTNYHGWQKQKNGVSVCETVENAIFIATGEKVSVTGSGRTDAGVHALGQTAHFDTSATIPPEKFYKALNPFLPSDIRVVASKEVDKSFNACRTAKKKTYAYSFYVSNVENPLLDRYAMHLRDNPDFSLIESAINELVGEHDFRAFCASGSTAKTTVRTIYGIEIVKNKNGFSLEFTGNGFLYNMVRIISGALIDVGNSVKTKTDIIEALRTGKRDLLGKTLPAKALTLKSVEY